MVVEEFITITDWLPIATIWFVGIALSLLVLGTIYGYLISAVRHGPREALYVVAKELVTSVPDVIQTAFRRVYAIALLTVKESFRRRVLLVAMVILALGLLAGGWYLDVQSDHPDRLYISVVLTGTQWLVLAMAFLLSAFSLPNDIKDKTIYTVVTKPVRAIEIVLGRIVGFTALGTAFLIVMWLISYGFVVRGLSHSHEISPADLVEVEPDSRSAAAAARAGADGTPAALRKEGKTTYVNHHRHTVTVMPDGSAFADIQMGHTHTVTARASDDGSITYRLGPQQGMLQARVPIYGKLRFLDSAGRPGKGISVGSEWDYRSFIEGGSLAAAIWRFEGIHAADFMHDLTSEERRALLKPEDQRSEKETELAAQADEKMGLPIELTLSVFRTHKGDIERRIIGEYTVRNPTSGIESEPRTFISQEYSTQQLTIPKKLRGEDADGRLRELDLFDDLVDENGDVEIWIRCAEPGQYFGMAQADVYIRARSGSFFFNFFKAYAGIWMQMLLVICIGVTFSTFLNSAVTMLATSATIVLGSWIDRIRELASGEAPGGGPIESAIRIVTQDNIMSELDAGIMTGPIKVIDWCLLKMVEGMTYMVPDFGFLDTSSYVAYGYNISWHIVAVHLIMTLAFFVVLTTLSYFIFKTREIAA